MTPFSISGLLAGVSALGFGFFTLLRSSNPKLSRIWFIFKVAASGWGFGALWIGLVNSPDEGLLAWRVAYMFGVIWISPLFFHFICTFLDLRQKWPIVIQYVIGGIFWLFVPSTLFFEKTELVFQSIYYARGGVLYPIFFLWWMGLVLFSHIQLIRYMSEMSVLKQNQIKYFFLATMVGFAGGATAYLPNFGIDIYPWGNFTVSLYPVIMSYAILRFKLMDMSLIIRWGIAYGSTILIAVGSFVFLTFALESFVSSYMPVIGKGIVTLFAACVAVIIFEPTRKKISLFVDKFIFKSPDYVSIISGIEQNIVNSNDLDSITNRLIDNFKFIWNVNHAGFAIWDISRLEFQLYPTNVFNNFPVTKMGGKIDRGDYLIRTLESERRLFKFGVIARDEIEGLMHQSSPGEKITFSKIRRTMLWLGASICVPLMSEDALSGIIILGPKKDLTTYNAEDKKFLSHVAEMVSYSIKKMVYKQIAI